MNTEPVHRLDGITLTEWILLLPGELPIDAVGLWQIIPEAREDFDLSGDELISCVRRSIRALVEHGAKPVRSGRRVGRRWLLQAQYGIEIDEIVDAIVSEWGGWGFGDPTANGIWFALPELFG